MPAVNIKAELTLLSAYSEKIYQLTQLPRESQNPEVIACMHHYINQLMQHTNKTAQAAFDWIDNGSEHTLGEWDAIYAATVPKQPSSVRPVGSYVDEQAVPYKARAFEEHQAPEWDQTVTKSAHPKPRGYSNPGPPATTTAQPMYHGPGSRGPPSGPHVPTPHYQQHQRGPGGPPGYAPKPRGGPMTTTTTTTTTSTSPQQVQGGLDVWLTKSGRADIASQPRPTTFDNSKTTRGGRW
eukprot:TRINITY_DN68175_c5_g6_i1.p1 TRINITY_DN68175_c5_g6~~TRINITY_DN68175_c5_g6_i1.p1  ORF type:complete len:238 (+),score=23.50 TRINITY_DN68175_c5_g6_i1:47-760(+)